MPSDDEQASDTLNITLFHVTRLCFCFIVGALGEHAVPNPTTYPQSPYRKEVRSV